MAEHLKSRASIHVRCCSVVAGYRCADDIVMARRPRICADGKVCGESIENRGATGRDIKAAVLGNLYQVSRRFRLRDATLLSARHQQPVGNLRMVTPRAESSPSNCATPGETVRSPGTITAHSRFSRNSFDLICHWPKDDDFASPIWMMDQCRTNANAVAS